MLERASLSRRQPNHFSRNPERAIEVAHDRQVVDGEALRVAKRNEGYGDDSGDGDPSHQARAGERDGGGQECGRQQRDRKVYREGHKQRRDEANEETAERPAGGDAEVETRQVARIRDAAGLPLRGNTSKPETHRR